MGGASTFDMGSDEEAVRRVVEAFERSDWSEIDVRFGPLRIRLSAGEAGTRIAMTPSFVSPIRIPLDAGA